MVLDIKFNSFLFDFTETMRNWDQRERGAMTGPVWGSFIKPEYRLRFLTLITEMKPSHDLDPPRSATVTSAHNDVKDSLTWHLKLISISQWSSLLDLEWGRALSQPSLPSWTKKVCQFYNLRIKFVPDLWADNKLIILSQDLPSCLTQNSLILCHY